MSDSESAARLRAFALMIRYGHELFAATDLEGAAASALNNAHEVLPFVTASMFDCTDGRVRILAQYGQPKANEHSAQALDQIDAVRQWRVDAESVPPAPAGIVRRFVKVPLPAKATESQLEFVWLLEFEGEPPPTTDDVLKLMSMAAGEALAYQQLCRPRRKNFFRRIRKSTFWSAIGILLLLTMFIRVPESISTEFFVRAPQETTVYAWFDGAVAECLKKDGDRVKAGEVVVRYDVSQLAYRTAISRTQLAETQAELALTRQNAFTHPEELGRVKLLELKCQGLQVSVDEAQWYIDHSEVRSPADGIVALTEGEAARLENKAVRTGDELFRVLGGEGFEAEIPVNEREASVLRGDLAVQLFLHTAPERAIPAKILAIAHYPQLTEQKTWAYRVRVALNPDAVPADLRYGMRGIAKLSSGSVSLGYRMFKGAVLYLRGL